jgi:hypothetical protein
MATAVSTGSADLPDVNVWLALSVPEHVHHAAALQWWEHGAAPRCHFNRVTMLGLVRLLAQPRVMGPGALSAAAAFGIWQRWAALPEVVLQSDPAGLDSDLARLTAPDLPPRLLTDAYLAAFAMRAGLRLVSFDADFARFPALNWLQLQAAQA